MENANNWYFTKEQLATTPSRRSGVDINKELSYRQQAANFIQDMGQRLQVSQLCINTAIVYMHRFYVFHSFTDIHRNNLSVAALFLAAKVEEQPRKLEHVIKIAHACLHKDAPPLDVRSEAYAEKQFEVVTNESILLQTLGFVLAIEHPHTYVVKLCQMVKESLLRKIECLDDNKHDSCKDLAQTSYFMATTSLHMTTMCLQYKPTVVAAVCIHLACKWSSWKIEPCSEGKEWYYYVDKTVSPETIEGITQEFVVILESSPHRFKRKFIPQKTGEASGNGHSSRNVLEDSSKHHPADNKPLVKKDISSPGPSTSSSSSFTLNSQVEKPPKVAVKVESGEKRHLSQPHSPLEVVSKKMKVSSSHSISIDAYREKKERERLELKIAPPPPIEPNVQQNVTNKPQLALNENDKVHKHVSNSVESIPHSSKEKVTKNIISQETLHQVHPAAVSKVNHHLPKKPDSKESKSNLLKIPSNVSSDPVVVLERVDVKSEVHDSSVPEKSRASPCKLKNAQENYSASLDSVPESKIPVPIPPTTPPLVVSKSKHHKHKANSMRSNHNSIHPHSQKPDKDIKTNGSKETELSESKNSVVENSVISVKTSSSSFDKHEVRDKHEKREKYKSKHSSSSSRDKIVNSESLNPIKVKIRKEVINKLPEKSPKVQSSSSSREESPKTSLKIKLPKPPATTPEPVTPSLKIVLTKDKSGSGTYCTSRKNDRESRKRAHSPSSRHESNYKGETPSKHIKLDHAHTHSSAKQSKVRHSSSRHTDHVSNSVSSNKLNVGNETGDYHNVESYADPAFCGNQYFVQMSPPPPPPPLPPLPNDTPVPGFKIKTNYNNYLSTQMPPHSE